jgi:tetratricopeptide (TPR) repeat protein
MTDKSVRPLVAGIGAVLAIAAISALACACRTRPQTVPLPVGPAVSEELIQEYVTLGDGLYQAMHLHAWRRAEEAYARAFDLAPRQEIRDKLALVKLLRMTREIDEDIPCPGLDADVEFICGNVPNPRAQALCDLARGYAAGPVAAAEQMKRVDPAVLQVDESPLDAYFFWLHSRTFGLDAREDGLRKRLSEKYRDSPLFMYQSLSMGSARVTQQYPDFAEAWEFSAEMSFQRTQLKPARAGFARTLELVPDYTRAITGLGNIYFFKLEDYENAYKTYDAALKWDPRSTAALFGKGAALHHLDQYDDSNATLDRMLATDLSRKGRVTRDSVLYYRGEANYYKAYNHHLKNDPGRARELIDLAKQDLPQSEEINYLSGLLYFNVGDLEAAKTDFERAARQGKNCYAYHYLGLIAFRTGAAGAASQFLTCTACLERSLRTFQQNIRSLSTLDIEAAEKQALSLRMEMKLVSYRDTAAELIQRMLAIVRGAELEDKWRQIYQDTMTDLLAKVKAMTVR